MTPRMPAAAWGLLALLLAVPALLPFSRSAEAPILLAAVMGLLALVRRWEGLVAHSATRALMLALAVYALAALTSSVDAVAPAKSWSTALATLRLLAFGLGISILVGRALDAGLQPAQLSRAIALAAALPVALWLVDALVQSATGWSLGGGLDADRLSGIFGADDLKLGPLLSALSPLLLWPLLDGPRWRLAATYLALLVVVLLAGARAGWINYALVSVWLAWRLARGSWKALLGWAAAGLLAASAFAAIGYQTSQSFRARVDRTLAAGDGQVDVALAGRTPIWQTALRMARAHPLNGVGVRGFRYAYPDYADAGDPWVDPLTHTGAAHAHQIVLELLTETGILGLGLWLAAAAWLWRCSRGSLGVAHASAPWIALAVLTFPLNTHLAFYSAFMGIVLAWLLTLACVQVRLQAGAPLVEGQQR